MDNNIATEQLELLCIRSAAERVRTPQARTASVSVCRDKPRRHRKGLAAMRRGAAFCLSAVLLTFTPEPSNILPDLVLQSEINGFPAAYSAADLPTIAFADKLLEQILPSSTAAPAETMSPQTSASSAEPPPPSAPIILDTGLDLPSNDRMSGGLLSRLFDLTPADSVRSLTIAPTSDYGYDACENILILNGSGKSLDLPALLAEPLAITAAVGEPKVLIYHTHACEAYTPGELDSYETDASDRCTDPAYSVVRVGSEMTAVLRSHGIGVIHDTTLYDEASYTGAYARSLAAVRETLAKYPSIEVVIDVHRDALNQPDAQKYKLVSEVDEATCAQLMLVMGTDAAAGDHPLWAENLKLALHIQQALLERSPTLARPIKLTRSSYNQFTASGAMIVEVGANGNALSEAIRSGQIFAEELAELLLAIE